MFNRLRKKIKNFFTIKIYDGWEDIRESLSLLKVTIWMGWIGTLLPFRDTKIGPYWITFICAIWVFSIGIIFNPNKAFEDVPFLTYVSIGIVLFDIIRAFLGEGSSAFTKEANIILNVPNPFFIYIIKVMVKAIIHFTMCLPVIILAMIIDRVTINLYFLLIFPGMILLLIFGTGTCLFLATIATRYRDIRFVMQASMRFLFFVTPVFWIKSSGVREIIAEFNPIYHLLTIIREPAMGTMPSLHSYIVSMLISLFALIIGFSIFSIMRNRIAHWL